MTGHLARKEIKQANGAVGGDGLAVVGLVLGYAQVAMFALALVAIGFITLAGDNIRTLFGANADSLAPPTTIQRRTSPPGRSPPQKKAPPPDEAE